MSPFRAIPFAGVLVAGIATAGPVAAQVRDVRSARVDSVFAAVDRTSSPGCAAGALQDGRFLHQRGYGMADLERRVPITPQTVFYTGSVSKQFTAMSVALLARDRRLDLDVPVRALLPEIPAAGAGITARHMVHHLSGLREKWDLLLLSGFRPANLVTQDDVLELVKRQRELNFAPGEDHLYNNTAYDLLATLVQRVTGKTIREFAAERIFGPLGMSRSQFVDDQSLLIPDRALGYSWRNGVPTQSPAYVETVGSGSVYSTVEDLARWDESFYTGALGDAELIRLVQTPGRLNDGTLLTYAFGLVVDRWRGQRRVQHGGALAGFRAQITRFPDLHFSAIVLCNYAQANPEAFANAIAEIYLGDRLERAPDRRGSTTLVAFGDPALATRMEGVYRSARTALALRVVRRDTVVLLEWGGTEIPLSKVGPDRARGVGPAEPVELRVVGAEGEAAVGVEASGLGPRTERFVRADPPIVTARAQSELAGPYRSEELGVAWEVVRTDTGLVARPPTGAALPLRPVYRDAYSAPGTGLLVFERDQRGRVRALLLSPGRSRNIRFVRTDRR